MNRKILMPALLACIVLSGCGEGEGGASAPQLGTTALTVDEGTASATTEFTPTIRDSDPLVTPTLTVSASLKQFTFTWTGVPGATSYRLMENRDGASEFKTVLVTDATSATRDIAVHELDWVNTLYRIEACVAKRCTSSSSTGIMNAMVSAIGYFKPITTAQPGIEFGTSVAISGDGMTLAVGAPNEDSAAQHDPFDHSATDSGAVYVFARVGGQWLPQAYLKASNTQGGDRFGSSVALSHDGNILAVGAPVEESSATGANPGPAAEENNDAPAAGAVYVYKRTAAQWSKQAYLKASNTGSGDLFGERVALSGNGATLAVSAKGEDSEAPGDEGDFANGEESGAVYVFTHGAQGLWSQQAKIKAHNPGIGDLFGESLALSADGDTLAVGAAREAGNATGTSGVPFPADNDDFDNSGAVYVFTRAATQWSQQAYVKASNTSGQDYFGSSVALSDDGDTLAVGAVGEDSNAIGVGGSETNNLSTNSGAVYVYRRSGTQWSKEAYVKASNTFTFDSFGDSVALSGDGDMLVVGATGEDSNAIGVGGSETNNLCSGSGAVYVYRRSGTQWSKSAYLKASNTPASFSGHRAFGHAVALSRSGETLGVSSPFESGNAAGVGGDQSEGDAWASGAVYMY